MQELAAHDPVWRVSPGFIAPAARVGGACGLPRERRGPRRNIVLSFHLGRLGELPGWPPGGALALRGRIVAEEGVLGGASRGRAAPPVAGRLPLLRTLLLAVAVGAGPL